MARKGKSTKPKSVISVNMKGVQSRQLLPEDDYRIRLVEAVAGESQGGNEQIEWVFRVNDGGKFDGQKLWLYTPLTETSLWKLHALLTALGVDVPDDELELDLEQMVEDELEMMGVVHHEKYDGTKRSKLMDFYAIDGDDEGGSTKSGGQLTRDAIEDMDRDELVELIEEHELEVDPEARGMKKDAKLREAIIEALEEAGKFGDGSDGDDDGDDDADDDADEKPAAKRGRKSKKAKADEDDDEDEKPSRKSKSKKAKDDDEDDEDDEDEKPAKGKKAAKGKKPKKLTADEVQDMDEEELADVIEKYELDVDLDDYKTLRKKSAAVIDALEEADLIEED